MKVSKTHYIQCFGIIVIILALVRCVFPRVAQNTHSPSPAGRFSPTITQGREQNANAIVDSSNLSNTVVASSTAEHLSPSLQGEKGESFKPHPIYSVSRFYLAFPDSQDVQLASAEKWGVQPVENRQDAEHRKSELTYIGASPYYCIGKLNNSIPYLVPRASVLLNDIGRSFFDSLYVKGIPLHKFIITSILRTKEDVVRLQQHNGNATEKSCHMYGTTIDISQNRYMTVQTAAHPRRQVRNDTLKWVLAEVLRDYREAGRCYIKYEVHQGCFHITVR